MRPTFQRSAILFSLLSAFFCSELLAQKTDLPVELSSLLSSQNPQIIAQYLTPQRIGYYVIDIQEPATHLTETSFFKIENNTPILLGKSHSTFPFARYITDTPIVDKLWQDYLARWLQKDSRETIQQKLNTWNGSAVSQEEIYYLSQAGFHIPLDIILVKSYDPDE